MQLKNSSKKVKITFKFFSFHSYFFKKFSPKILKKIWNLNLENTGFVSLPLKKYRYTVLRSPHVDKKSREHFEIKVYVKTISIFFNLNNFFEKQKAKLLIIFIKNSSSGFGLKIRFTI